MRKRKICIITATRAEYGLLKNLMHEIQQDTNLELQIIATGTHLSHDFGFTINSIIEDGYIPDKKIEMLLSSTTPVGLSKSMGLALIGFAEAFDELSPDLVVVLGDRFELLPIVSAANMANIPIAHLHGGELTEGSKDETFRHCITKLSHLHFTALPEYAKRVIQMGEQPSRVFNVGAIGLDALTSQPLLSFNDLESSLAIKFHAKNLLITYHPDTNDSVENSSTTINTLLQVLDELEDTLLIFTKANADAGGQEINQRLDEFCHQRPEKAILFDSLGRFRYLSALRYVDAIVGNSSSGIVEAASFHKAAINIGDRQKGRVRGDNVIDSECTIDSLHTAFSRLYSDEFQRCLPNIKNPYQADKSCQKIVAVLKNTNLNGLLIKSFHDIR